jgi:hypothetical protein
LRTGAAALAITQRDLAAGDKLAALENLKVRHTSGHSSRAGQDHELIRKIIAVCNHDSANFCRKCTRSQTRETLQADNHIRTTAIFNIKNNRNDRDGVTGANRHLAIGK